MMQTEGAVTYFVPDCFRVALSFVRRALANDGFDVTQELDLSRSIELMLGVVTAPCTVLCVWRPAEFEDKASMTALLPLHVVVSAQGGHTEIHIPGSLSCEGLPSSVLAPVTATQSHLARTLDRIAMRRPAFSLA